MLCLRNQIYLSQEMKYQKQLKYNTGAGPDKMINKFFIHGANILLPYFDVLFNIIFSNGNFPQDWSLGEIIPLHKKGSINNVDNYYLMPFHIYAYNGV